MARADVAGVDGCEHTIEADPKKPLLYTLRDELGLNNPLPAAAWPGGACTVHLNGRSIRSCVDPDLGGQRRGDHHHRRPRHAREAAPPQTAYVEEQVPQCGYCTNGFLMTGAALLKANPAPTDAEIRKALTGLKCRCGTHMSILRAVKAAAAKLTA